MWKWYAATNVGETQELSIMKLLPKLINPPKILSGSLKLRQCCWSFPNYYVVINIMQICLADAGINLFILLLSSYCYWRKKFCEFDNFSHFSHLYEFYYFSLRLLLCYITFAETIIASIIFVINLLFHCNKSKAYNVMTG